MVKIKKLVLYLLFIGFFTVYLLNANDIAILLSPYDNIEAVDLLSLPINENAYKAVDFVKSFDNMYEVFACNGWAFCETNEPNLNKKIDVIFRGAEHTYVARTKSIDRLIQSAFPDLSIQGSNHGFGAEISTIQLQPDTYEIMFYIWENEYAAGLARSGLKYIKDEDGFREYEHGQIDNLSEVQNSNDIRFSINAILDQSGSTVLFRGWGFQDNISTQFQDVYIECSDGLGNAITFDTVSYARADTAKYFKSSLYYNCGFEMNIPIDELPKWENIYCTVIIENDGIYKRAEVPIRLNIDTILA